MADLLKLIADREKQMLEAVTSRNIEDMAKLIENGVDVNCKLQKQGGNSALHLAAQLGDKSLVQYLLKVGGNPMMKNDLNSTPILLAARNRHLDCLIILIGAAKSLLGIESLWLQYNGSIFLWKESTESIIRCFLRCTPDINSLRHNTQKNLFFLCADKRMYECLKLWIILENNLSSSQEAYLNCDEDQFFLDWMFLYKREVKSLKHHSSLSIRRSFHGNCNVFYGSQVLPIPKSLQEYVSFK